MIDILCFLVVPVLVWRLIRGIVPMAVMPILTGLAVAVAADQFEFDKAVFGPSKSRRKHRLDRCALAHLQRRT